MNIYSYSSFRYFGGMTTKMACIITNDNSEISFDNDNECTENGNRLIHIACACSSLKKTKFDYNIEVRNKNGWTPLFSAVYANNQIAMELLLYRHDIRNDIDYFGNESRFYIKENSPKV